MASIPKKEAVSVTFIEFVKDYIYVFFVSMLPIVELRGAIPIGVGMGLPLLPTYLVAIIGNCLPVPFLIVFSKRVLQWLAGFPKIGHIFQRIIDKATEKSQAASFAKYEYLGLFLFVAIPLPGTGAWTGSLIAAILQLDWKKAFLTIAAGVLGAGIIMSLVSAGIFGSFGADLVFK